MVSFICNACGNTVKKNQVEKHYATQCKSCSSLSCIDCGVDFAGDSYSSHTNCITEAEKYHGHLYHAKDKENKGETKQKEWIKHVSSASGASEDPKLKSLLKKLSVYSNIPRKKKKFENFCKNSVNVYDTKTLDQLWDVFNASNEKQDSTPTSGTGSDEETKAVAITENNMEAEDDCTQEEVNTEAVMNNDSENLEIECTHKTKKHKKKKNKTSKGSNNISNNESENIKIDKKNEENIDNDESYAGNLSALDIISDETCNESIKSMEFIDHNGCQENQSYKLKKKKKNRQLNEESVDNEIENNVTTVEPTQKTKKSKKSRKRLNNEIQDGDSKSSEVMINEDNNSGSKKQKKKKNGKHKSIEETPKEENIHVKSKKKQKKEEEEGEIEDEKENCEDEVNAVPQGKFNWHKTIKMILKENDEHELSVKKLRKKVLAAYQEHGIDHRAATLDESRALFDKKLKTNPKIKVLKDVAKLVK